MCVPLAAPLAKRKTTSFHPEVPQGYVSGGCKPLLDSIIYGFLQMIVQLVLAFLGSWCMQITDKLDCSAKV